MRVVAWDTWAFVEVALDGPRRAAVEDLLRSADVVVTARDVVAETFNFLVRVTGQTEAGWTWWSALAQSRVRVVEAPMRDLQEAMATRDRRGGLSFTDHALAHAARAHHTSEVATEDREFRRLGLTPLFAR